MITPAYQRPPPPSGNIRSRHLVPPLRLFPPIKCALSKQGQRFLSSLTTAVDPSVAIRLIRRFVASSPKSVTLNALCHLLSPNTTHPHLSYLVIPLYCRITDASRFSYNPKLVADVVALLYKLERFVEAETLVSEAVSKSGFRERDLCLLYCSLVDSHSQQSSNLGFLDTYGRLKHLVSMSSSVYVKRRAYKSMISGLCMMSLPREAEEVMEEMRFSGIKPSVFEFRSVVHGYGRLGMFEDMNGIIDRMGNLGFAVDTICSNMVLSSYGVHNNQSQMLLWLRKMKELGNSFSIRTYNSVLNSIPTMASMLQNPEPFPLSIGELIEFLNGNEASLVQELINSSVLRDVMEWNSIELKLDLHGMHLCCAYLILLQWMEELQCRFRAGTWVVPTGVTVVCGTGKHSIVRGESPVKGLVKEMMVRTKSPVRIERKNTGCFIAKGETVKQWLC